MLEKNKIEKFSQDLLEHTSRGLLINDLIFIMAYKSDFFIFFFLLMVRLFGARGCPFDKP